MAAMLTMTKEGWCLKTHRGSKFNKRSERRYFKLEGFNVAYFKKDTLADPTTASGAAAGARGSKWRLGQLLRRRKRKPADGKAKEVDLGTNSLHLDYRGRLCLGKNADIFGDLETQHCFQYYKR